MILFIQFKQRVTVERRLAIRFNKVYSERMLYTGSIFANSAPVFNSDVAFARASSLTQVQCQHVTFRCLFAVAVEVDY